MIVKKLFCNSDSPVAHCNGTFSKIAFYAFLLLVVDCSISGAGRWQMFGPLSIRMVFGVISIVFSFPMLVRKFKNIIRNPMVFSLILFVLYVMSSAIIGYNKGNRIDVLISDLKGFSWLFIVPVGIVLVDSKEKLLIIMKTIIVSSIIHSLIAIGFNISLVFFDKNVYDLATYIQEIQFGFIDVVAEDLFRFSFGSTLTVVASCIFMVYFQMYQNKINWIFILATAICFFALLISYSRSIYGATFIAFIITLFGYLMYFPKKRLQLFIFLVLVLVFTSLLILGFQTTPKNNYFLFGLQRTFPNISFDAMQDAVSNKPKIIFQSNDVNVTAIQKTETSISQTNTVAVYLHITNTTDTYRNDTKKEIFEMIKQKPLLGNGLGASISSRSTGLVEYVYYDLLNKVGIIGLILYFFPAIYMFFMLINTFRFSDKIWIIKFTWFCGFSAFLIATYFNPYMNCSLGIYFYGLSIAAFCV